MYSGDEYYDDDTTSGPLDTDRFATKEKGGWPAPTDDEPDMECLEEMINDSWCVATDGCDVEPDSICAHGHPSWLLAMGLI